MVYLISGLGADARMFTKLNLGSEHEFKHIVWIKESSGESLKDYCKRLINQIDLTQKIDIIGMSFGGIVAQEISRLIPVRKLIIISSVKSPDEFGFALSLIRKSAVYRIVPKWFLKWSNLLTGDYYFGTKTKEESKLLKAIIRDTESDFLKWSIKQVMTWKGGLISTPIVHIHGDADRIFTKEKIKNCHWIKGGGHLMIHNRGEEVSELVRASLKE
ncbi:MAG: alpha/beta hydrolase [Cytophagales bacterium]